MSQQFASGEVLGVYLSHQCLPSVNNMFLVKMMNNMSQQFASGEVAEVYLSHQCLLSVNIMINNMV